MTPKLVKPKGTSKADASSSRPPVQQSIEQPTMDEEKHTPPRKEAKGDLAHDLINEMLASARKRQQVQQNQLERQYRVSVVNLRADIEEAFRVKKNRRAPNIAKKMAELKQLLNEERKIVEEIDAVAKTLQTETGKREEELAVVLKARKEAVDVYGAGVSAACKQT